MRLKHVKGASERVCTSAAILLTPEKYKGTFQSLFSNNNPIHIEIGTGKGDFIINMAKRYPEINFIGIEKYDSVIVRALDKVKEEKPANLFFIRMDATKIETIFENEIDTVYLNFSDPWPKERHAKRRLTSHEFLARYDAIFKDKKHIVMKTDNRHLFEYSIMSLTEYGYHIEDISLNLYEEDTSSNIPTEYETKFHELGYPIYKIEVSK